MAGSESPVGRLAPSPTGFLHLGNARTFLVAWLQMRSLGGRILLRLEDIDQARAVPGALEAIVADLSWLGLDWDNQGEEPWLQSRRTASYREALERLSGSGLLYECFCSRRELQAIASAPHGATTRYPGICRGLTEEEKIVRREAKEPSLRFMPPEGLEVCFDDLIVGRCCEVVSEVAGDVIVVRGDAVVSYQLAVVVDDIAMGVTHVVRGMDLLPSTPRQILLTEALGGIPPAYAHLPLIYGPDGERLAKRHAPLSLQELRARGRRAEEVVGWLAWSAGLRATPDEVAAAELVEDFRMERLIREGTRLTVEEIAWLLR